jgi:DNA-binding LacI/PurR family transcriptional regulator
VVFLDRYLRGVRCAVVSSDNVAGSRMLTQELLDAGHRRICLLSFPPRFTSSTEDRLGGFIQACTGAGVPVDYSLHYIQNPSRLVDDPAWEPSADVVQNFAEFLRDQPDVTAIYAFNAELALVACRAIALLDLRIPDEISLVCVDLLEAIPMALPAITCATQQGETMGRTALTLLQEVIAGKPPRIVLLPMSLRRAGSVAPPTARPRRAFVPVAPAP